MGIRIQPLKIEVPENDPFKNDLLDRKDSVKVLTSIVGSIEGPCVLAVDAAWGTGKTTFLRMWMQYLRNDGFPVVYFNAWETDFAGDPFVVLSAELSEGLKPYANQGLITDLENASKEVIRRAIPGLIRVVTAGILDISPLIEKETGDALASYAKERLSNQKFREKLETTAKALAKAKGGKPLVVLIDELDRCRPSYAIELLEIAKHLFTVDDVVFVLSMDRSELMHSIKVLYGNDFGAEDYLRRFIDFDYRLPDPDRKAFVEALLRSVGIVEYLTTHSVYQAGDVLELLLLFGKSRLDLRTVAQAIHRLGLVLVSSPPTRSLFLLTLVFLSIMRTIDSHTYRRFIDGESTDQEVVETMFKISGFDTLRDTVVGNLVEALIIAVKRRLCLDETPAEDPPCPSKMPLYEQYEQYKELSKAEPKAELSNDPERAQSQERAREVMKHIEDIGDLESYTVKKAVEHLELLSADLIRK
ncbi:MAG: hypothetical protein J4G05_10665 [Chlorobi bacterium]|nr:hypothetical protein [Chlorobiota bacterium]